MHRKLTLTLSAGAMALFLLFSTSAGATAARVKGKFPPIPDKATAVLGSAKAKPMGDGVQRVGLTLQHVWRADYRVWINTYVDANGNGAVDPAEIQGARWVDDCDLSQPSKKGHAGCVAYLTLVGTPFEIRLVAPGATDAVAALK